MAELGGSNFYTVFTILLFFAHTVLTEQRQGSCSVEGGVSLPLTWNLHLTLP